MENSTGLVYVGKIIEIDPIEGADFIACATVVCGRGGKWEGVVVRSKENISAHQPISFKVINLNYEK